MGLRNLVKKGAKKAKKGAKKAGRKVSKTAKKATKEVEKKAKDAAKKAEATARKAAKEADKIARDAAKEAERLAELVEEELKEGIMSVIDDIKDLAGKAKREVEGIVNTAKEEIEEASNSVKKEVEDAVKKVGSEVEDGLREAGKEIEKTFEERIPEFFTKQAPKIAIAVATDGLDEAQAIANEMQKAICKPGLRASKSLLQGTYDGMCMVHDEAPELVQYLDSPGFNVKLGVLSLSWSGMYTRAETILGVFDRWIDSPPDFSRRDIRDFLISFGPDEAEFDIDLKLNVVVVGSSVMEIGGKVPNIPFPLVVFLLDKVLEAAGVPE